jgi:tetratricopeptide (TPR) repeat protein
MDEARSSLKLAERHFPPSNTLGLQSAFLSIRASIEIDECHYQDALQTLDDALLCAAQPEEKARVHLQKSMIWLYSGELLEALREVERAVDFLRESDEPCLIYTAAQHRVELLSRLGRFEDAAALLPKVRTLMEVERSTLHILRLDWVEARIAAGLGRVAEGEALYRQVRAAFLEHGLPYKAAIATVELARHLFRQGRFPEVAALAMESAAEFRRQGVEPEVLGALALLEEATSGHLTLKAIEQLLKRIEHAAHGR